MAAWRTRLAAALRSRWTFEIVVAGVLLALALSQVDLRSVGESLAGAQYGWALLAVLIYAGTRVLHTLHWRFYLEKVGRPPFAGLLGAFLIGNFVDNVLVARIGEIARMQIVANRYGLSRAGMFAGRAAEILIDAATMIVLLIIAVALLQFAFAAEAVLWVIAALGAGAFVALSLMSRLLPRDVPQWRPLERLPPRWQHSLADAWPRFHDGLEALRNTRLLAIVLGLTAAGFSVEILMFWTYGLAFGLGLPFTAFVIVVVAVGIVRAFSITFQDIGTYEVVVIEVLARQGASRDDAFAYAVATRIFTSLSITAMGLLAMWLMRVRPRDVFAVRREAAGASTAASETSRAGAPRAP